MTCQHHRDASPPPADALARLALTSPRGPIARRLAAFTLGMIMTASALAADTAFTDYGIAAQVAECRGVVTLRTAQGRNLVIAMALDLSPLGYILVTDIDSGETRQVFYPKGAGNSPVYASMLSRNGRFYTAAGGVLLEFDPERSEWLYHGVPQPGAQCFVGEAMSDAPDGLIYGGTCNNCHLISYNPSTRETVDHGRLDPQEQYFSYLAFDSAGWAYAGIGTARWNIVAFNPKTGEKRTIIAEADRKVGTARVVTGTDGRVYGSAGSLLYRLFEGQAERITPDQAAKAAPSGTIGWNARTGTFPDGRQLTAYDLPGRRLEILDPKSGERRTLTFDYQPGGVGVTSLAAGPDAAVYASTSHPMHLSRIGLGDQTLRDLGPIPKVGGGNFCSMATQGNLLIGAQYSAGALWAYDVTRPWQPGAVGRAVTLGTPARDLVDKGQVTGGHFTYLESLDLAFLCGDHFNAEGRWPVSVPAAGAYYVHIQPYVSERYCRVQYLLDGKPLGEPFNSASATRGHGPLQVFGPVALTAGEHWVGVRQLETPGQEPWSATASIDVSRERRDSLIATTDDPNPRVLAAWHEDICRPRAALAHPDGKHVMMAGFAGYGRCGGGLGMVNLETGEATLLGAETDLLPSHSTIALRALPDGNLVGGTSISAPGGGHVQATEAELWILDWATRRLVYHDRPVAGATSIVALEVGPDGIVYGLANQGTLFLFDPQRRVVLDRADLSAHGTVPRHALQRGPDGRLYAMFSKAILRLTPGSTAVEVLSTPPQPISAGGALADGRLYYASGPNLWSYALPR